MQEQEKRKRERALPPFPQRVSSIRLNNYLSFLIPNSWPASRKDSRVQGLTRGKYMNRNQGKWSVYTWDGISAFRPLTTEPHFSPEALKSFCNPAITKARLGSRERQVTLSFKGVWGCTGVICRNLRKSPGSAPFSPHKGKIIPYFKVAWKPNKSHEFWPQTMTGSCGV